MTRSKNRRAAAPAPPSDVHPADWQELARKSEAHGRWFRGRQPKPVGDVLAQLVQRKGYAQLQLAGELSQAWNEIAGPLLAKQTLLGSTRRGVLEVVVANSLLIQELGFQKRQLLEALQQRVPEAGVRELRFRVGAVGGPDVQG